MPDLMRVAEEIYSWAQSNNLFVGSTPGTSSQALTDRVNPLVEPLNEQLPIFKKRGISFLSYNSERSIIYIHTSGRLTKKDKRLLPASTDGVTVEYMQTKQLSIGHPASALPPGQNPYNLHNGKYTCGSSISVGNYRDAGTLSCLVKKNGELFGLTCNHVAGGCNNTKSDTPIVAPGVADVCYTSIDPFTIGRHHSVLPMSQGDPAFINCDANRDAALISIRNETNITSMQGTFYDTPVSVMEPIDNMRVEKVGRTTGNTHGTVLSKVFKPIAIMCNAKSYPSANEEESVTFQGVVYFTNIFVVTGANGRFSLPGDSGSLVVHSDANNTRHAVGMLFAGNENVTFILPIKPILDELGVSLVDNFNVT